MKPVCCAMMLMSVAAPVAAFDAMTPALCQASYQRVADMAVPGDPQVAQQMRSIGISGDNWCQIRRDAPGFEDAEFDTFEWRTEQTVLWTEQGVPPLAIQLRATGLVPDEMQDSAPTDRPPLSAEATLRQLPDAGQVIVERAVVRNDVGDELAVSGVFERVFLSSTSMMQVSMGSAAFKAGLMSMTLEGTHENPFGFYVDVDVQGVPQAQRDAAFAMISNLPDGVVDDASRAELTAYAGDLPRPVGTLEVSVASARGLGLMQVGMSLYSSFTAIMDDTGQSDQMDLLLDGVTLRADWTPTAQVAD